MTHILFVDDEPKMLKGLERMLLPRRKAWNMSFQGDGSAALEEMNKREFDILVTDMRMPGMGGDRLLDQVREHHPRVTRIVLSGQSDLDAVMKTAKLAHQYLAKPCESAELIAVLDRVARFRDALRNKEMIGLISQLDTLPSPAEHHREVVERLSSEEVSLPKVAEAIQKDMGMSSVILKLVNSSFFGLPRTISDLKEGVVFLGVEKIKALVLTHHIFTVFGFEKLPNFNYELLWKHSLNTAAMARVIASLESDDKSLINDTFVAGLMHDIGKLVLGYVLTREYNQVIEEVRSRNIRVYNMEKEMLGITHAEVGSYLSGIWGTSERVVQAILHHHRPSEAISANVLPLAAVSAANVFEHSLRQINQEYKKPLLDMKYLDNNHLAVRLKTWLSLCRDICQQDEEI